MRFPLFFSISCVLLLGVFAYAGEAPAWEKAWREPLTRTTTSTYLKSWLICGPFDVIPAISASTDFLKASGGEAAAHPVVGDTVARPDGTTVTWTAYTSATDYLNFTPAFGGKLRMNTVAYAYTVITRPQAGTAYLAVGSDDGVRIWLNGKLVHERVMTRGMFPDNDLVQVTLQAGENRLLVKVEQAIEFWAFMLRVVEEDEVARLQPQRDMPTRLWPAIVSSNVDHLVIASDCGWDMPPRLQAPVEVRVTGIGGVAVASQTVPYRQSASFTISRWPDGPYDIACTITRADGTRLLARRSWYKGDALTAARQLLAAAPPRSSTKPDDLLHNHLVDLLTSRLGDKLQYAGAGSLEFIYPILMDYAELRQEQAGGVGPRHGGSLVRLAYWDEVDASPQFARAYLPTGYDPAKKWPMIVVLHGSQPGNPRYVNSLGAWWRFDILYEDCGAIILYPHGRGNISYKGDGETDVLRIIVQAKARLSVDDDRVYLMGSSMGGSGAWQIGTHHPELFAAMGVVYGGWDYRVTDTPEEIAAMSPAERFRTECAGTFSQLESLRTTPVFVTHGDQDGTVNVGNSRFAVSQLQRWGYPVRYWEVPGKHHEPLGTEDRIIPWLLQYRRDAQPRHVSLRSGELKFAAAHWVRIDQRVSPLAFMHAEAEIIAPNAIRLETENVLALTLSPRHALIDPVQPVRVIWNDILQEVRLVDGQLRLRAEGYTPVPGMKRATLEGPISDAQAQPFAIVVGTTSPDARMHAFIQMRAKELISTWERRLHWTPRVYRDTEISEVDIARYSLFLLGGPAENSVTHALANRLPLQVDADGIILDGRRISAHDAVAQVIVPHPLNTERYVVVTAPTSAAGMYQASRLRTDLDFEVLDGRRTAVARGTFDRCWHLQEAYTEFGDLKTRATEPLRTAPALLSAKQSGLRLPLSTLLESSVDGTFRDMLRDTTAAGTPLRLGQRTYRSGLSVPLWWYGGVEYVIADAGWTRLHVVVGLELPTKLTKAQREGVKVTAVVKGDGKELARVQLIADKPAVPLTVNITGVNTLRLEIANDGDENAHVRSIDWADAMLER